MKTVTEILEEQLTQVRHAVHDTLLNLADKPGWSVPRIEVALEKEAQIENPHYIKNTLLIPEADISMIIQPAEQGVYFSRSKSVVRLNADVVTISARLNHREKYVSLPETQKKIRLGMMAGLILQQHLNPKLRQSFEGLTPLQQEQSPRYLFWSAYSSAYVGLVVVGQEGKEGMHFARKEAEGLRAHVKQNIVAEPSTCFYGLDYAAQVFLKHGTTKLHEVLTASEPTQVHQLVTPNDDFYHYIIDPKSNWNTVERK